MSLCAFCGHPTGHPGGLCGHHSAGHGDGWARGNRLMCDLLHRGITSSRPHEVDRLEREGRTCADELGDRAIFARLDVTSDRDWAATVAAAEDAFGPVSVLVNTRASCASDRSRRPWRRPAAMWSTAILTARF